MIKGLHFHHIGVACRNIEKEIQAFAVLGYDRDSEIITDPLQGIHCCFLKGPALRIELLAPADDTSPLIPWLDRGVKMYHQAFECESVTTAIAQLESHGAVVMSQQKHAKAFSGRNIAFLMLPNMLLIELIQFE